jgi:hypothetical protein
MSAHYGPNIVTDGLLFLFDASNHKSYPGSGTSLTDIIGKLIGTMTGVTVTNGHFNFDGANDVIDFGTLASPLINVFSGGGTVSVWIRAESDGEGNLGRIATTGSGGNGWFFLVREEASSALRVGFGASGTAGTNEWKTTNRYPINEWMFVTVTWDSDLITTAATIYINGVSVAVTASTVGGSVDDTGRPLHVGNLDTIRTFDGDIDVLSFYNRKLTAAEVQQNFNAHRGRFEL